MNSPEPLPSEVDRALVAAVLARAPGAFERLVSRYQALCWHIVNRMVRNPDDTRELCQETFLRVHLRLHQFRFESPLKAWIGQVAYSIALRHLGRQRPTPVNTELDDADYLLEQMSDAFDLESASAHAELCAALRVEIEALPAIPRTVLMLYHLDEVPIDEIAHITGLAVGTIKS